MPDLFPKPLQKLVEKYRGTTIYTLKSLGFSMSYNSDVGLTQGIYKRLSPGTQDKHETGEILTEEGLFRDYTNGILTAEIVFINGKKEGLYREWWTNGQISTKMMFKNDIPGPEEGWEEDGRPILHIYLDKTWDGTQWINEI